MALVHTLEEALDLVAMPATECGRLLSLLAGSRALRLSVRDHSGRIIWVNAAAEEDTRQLSWDDGRLGTDRARYFDLEGRPIKGLDHPAQQTHATGTAVEDESVVIERDDGTRRWFLMSSYPLTVGASGWSVLVVGTDVTAVWKRARGDRAA